MKKLVLLAVAMFFCFSLSAAFAGSVVESSSSSNSSAGVYNAPQTTIYNSTPNNNMGMTLQQSSAAPDPGMNRFYANPVQPYQPGLIPYLGPWREGANILEDLTTIPSVMTLDQARSLYNGGVTVKVHLISPVKWTFKEVKLLNLNDILKPKMVDRKPVLDKDGKPVMYVDETMFVRRAFILAKGAKSADTIDVLAKVAENAMLSGGNGMILLKKHSDTGVSAGGFGFGLGGVTATLGGDKKEQAQTGSAGTGINFAWADPVFKESMWVLVIDLKPIQQ